MDESGSASEASSAAIVDVSGLPIRDLISSDETVLTNALRRVMADLDIVQDNFAAFGNTPR